MEWIKVDSSSLSRIKYNENTRILEIEFKGGRLYQYFDVPFQIFEGLRSADSHGKYFNKLIKDRYHYKQV
jgi:hypothetical protein